MRRLLQPCWVAATLQACLVIANFIRQEILRDNFLLRTKKGKYGDLLPVEFPPAFCPALLKLAFPDALPHLVELLAARHRLEGAEDIASRTSPTKGLKTKI